MEEAAAAAAAAACAVEEAGQGGGSGEAARLAAGCAQLRATLAALAVVRGQAPGSASREDEMDQQREPCWQSAG